METFADKINDFNRSLAFNGNLPEGITMMNPFLDKEVMRVSSEFYNKYYNNHHERHIILGINPGRFGAGLTGIPFTDPKRLEAECEISFTGVKAHEPSSVFVYEVIAAYGGISDFYRNFYINSVCPLGFTSSGKNGKEVNYNYYDSKELTDAVYPFIVESIWKQIGFGIKRDVGFCFGNGKNEKFLRQLNEKEKFFGEIIALEHPRFVMQYKARSKQVYIDKYLAAFRSV